MSKTPTRNPSTITSEAFAESDDRCEKKKRNFFLEATRNFDVFSVDENSPENQIDFGSTNIRQNEHAFFSDVTTMKELENDLTDLLQRFREGTLLAFSKKIASIFRGEKANVSLFFLPGPQFTCTKMDTIRETQEQLARLHFSLDKELSTIKLERRKYFALFIFTFSFQHRVR